ncbi:MAG: HAMP domain-containing histidine kinase [Solirubrobacterales bacterium]|nr:HAMP domain-containing histidine kinase [Solirubrobacterales bacterium]
MKIPRPGLRGKLALAIAMVLLLALGITYLAVYRGTGAELESRTESDLEREMERLTTALTQFGPGSPLEYRATAERIAVAESFGPNARVVSISIAGGGTVTNQPGLVGPGLPGHGPDVHMDDRPGPEGDDDDDGHGDEERRENAERILGAGPGQTTVKIDGAGKVRLLTRQVDLPGGVEATARVGQPLAPVDAALEGLSDTLLIVGAATLLLGALAGWLLAATATRPMRRMAAVAEGVDGGDLSARMPVEGTRDEARRLAESFNSMLDRLERAFERQRVFVADASHDLRTPLTVVRGQIEVLARNPDPGSAEVQRVSHLVTQAISRMEAMVEDLLLLARSESAESMRLETLDLGPLLLAEVEGLSFTGDRDLVVGSITDRSVSIDREQIARALSNLISNAVTHTHEGGRIEVSARDQGSMVALTVDDDGPGVPTHERDRIFDRFARLSQSRTSTSGGSGLGLAIVKAIAEAHGGTVSCSGSPLGGARFEILLPVREISL